MKMVFLRPMHKPQIRSQKNINGRMANLINTVKQVSINTADTLTGVAKEMLDQTHFHLAFLQKMFQHESAVKNILFHLNLFQDSNTQLTHVFLPSFLVTPEI